MTARLAITVLMPEAEARAMLRMAEAAGHLIDPATVEIDGFVLVSRTAFEGLLRALEAKVLGESCGGAGLAKAGAGAALPRPGG